MCSPKSSHTASVQLEVGDVVLVATDGLFHNMNSKDIVDLIQEFQVRIWFVVSLFDFFPAYMASVVACLCPGLLSSVGES